MKTLKSPFNADIIKIMYVPLSQAHGKVVSKVLEYAQWISNSTLCIMLVKNKTIHGLTFFIVGLNFGKQAGVLVQNSVNIPVSIALDTTPYVYYNIPLKISMTLEKDIMHGYLWIDKEANIKKEYLRIAMS